jgi:hypothetical protein
VAAADQLYLALRVGTASLPLTRKGLPSGGLCLQFPLMVDPDHAY